MTPEIAPYTPSLYQAGSQGRYRQYGTYVRTPIPGAMAEQDATLVWAEQELNLDGAGSRAGQHYGNYSLAPLRGVEDEEAAVAEEVSSASFVPIAVMTTVDVVDLGREIGRAVAGLSDAPPESGVDAFLNRKLGPVPVWSLGLVGLAALGGLTAVLLRKRKPVTANRRGRR